MKDCCRHEEEEEDFCHDDEGSCSKEEYFLEIADCAWTEVLKDKIKEHILQNQGDRLTELAKIVSEANGKRWKGEMEGKQAMMEFAEQIHNFFSKK